MMGDRDMKTVLKILTRIVGIVIGVLVLVVIIAWLSGAFIDKVPPERVGHSSRTLAEGAAVETVQKVVKPIFEKAAGSVVASRRTAVSSRILATIKSINVRAGDNVKKGDALIILDDRDLQSRVEQASETLRSAEAQLANAKAEFDRQSTLFEQKITAKNDYDRAETAFRVAQAEVERAKKSIEETKVGVSFSDIRSPVNGRVVDRLAEPGDTASPGSPILQLYDPSALQLEAAVRESIATRLKVGDTLDVHIDSLDKTLEGRVDEIVPQAEAGSRVFRVKVGLPLDDGLYTGMFGRLIIPVGEREMLLIAEKGVESIGQNRFVHVVGDERRITRRLVTLGPPVGDEMVEVLSGLIAGESLAIP